MALAGPPAPASRRALPGHGSGRVQPFLAGPAQYTRQQPGSGQGVSPRAAGG